VPLERRLGVLAAVTALRDALLTTAAVWEGGDCLHLTYLGFDATALVQARKARPCEICEEEGWEQMLLIAPCMHELCRKCLVGHQRACAERGQPGPLPCPMCRGEVEQVVDLAEARGSFPFWDRGGTLVRSFAALASEASEALQWASKATDPAHRPPFPVKVLRLTIVERDGTVDNATCFVSDGLRLEHVLKTENCLGASLFDRRDGQGRWQCTNPECMAFESPEEGRKASLCTGCRVARFCSSDCQRMAWTLGHKRMCQLWKAHQAARQDEGKGKGVHD
jgi:hypothetical protein